MNIEYGGHAVYPPGEYLIYPLLLLLLLFNVWMKIKFENLIRNIFLIQTIESRILMDELIDVFHK